jgi:2-oxoglutarate dehydrogenase E1 component
VYNTTLSEFAALGFEYGYSMSAPSALVIWEAQFGDFANGAQVIVDQYLSSAWQKWGRMSGLVMLLPHGYEGQGPEHSSARLERYLQLCAQNNMQVCVPSTPAQYFHLLRRQVKRRMRCPLVVITPKSLLRHPLAISELSHITSGSFQTVLDDLQGRVPQDLSRLVLCSGKVYYDLLEQKNQLGLENVVLCRLEQLYPFPKAVLRKLFKRYAHVATIVWCQEEPYNQGAWYILQERIRECMTANQALHYAGRPVMASSAPGDQKQYLAQQKALVDSALGVDTEHKTR